MRSHVRRHRRSPRFAPQAEHASRTHIVGSPRAGRQTVSAADVSPQFGMGHCVTSSHLPKNAASAALTVLADPPAEVASMSLSVADVLYGESGSTFGSTLAVTLDDGTHYSDLHSLEWLDAAALLSYATDVPAAVTVDAGGELTLLDNHERPVTITATTACDPRVSASASTAPNLRVPFRCVDLGANDGLQFRVSGGAVAVPAWLVTNSAVGGKAIIGPPLHVHVCACACACARARACARACARA